MQSAVLRHALRASPRSTSINPLPKQSVSRRFASEAPGGAARSEPAGSASPVDTGSSRKTPIFIGGALVIAMVAGRYILASDKPARSEQAAQQQIRKEQDLSNHRHDPRDSGIKTLEQKKQKEQSS